jgi:hypothetical protein
MTVSNSLFISDLHLTDRPADVYRWKVFEQCAELSTTYGFTDLYVLGDLTEAKDYHSSLLVNRIVDSFYVLRKTSRINEIYFLKGNHDGLDKDHPYFLFLRRIPWAKMFVEPTFLDKGKDTILFLPHTKTPEDDWKDLELGLASLILLHGTVTGAVSESGQKMEGIPLSLFKGLRCPILAGDIHVPQKVGAVEYVGAPYPIRFGDEYQGRALGYVNGKLGEFPLENIRKHTLRVEGVLGKQERGLAKALHAGDHVKFIISLSDSEMGEWQQRKKWCMDFAASHQVLVGKIQLERRAGTPGTVNIKPSLAALRLKVRSPEESLALFCKTNRVELELVQLGQDLLQEEVSQ